MADKVTENLVELLARWREDPLAFVTEAFVDPPVPEEWHKKVLNALPVEDRIAIRSGHGVGKALEARTPVLTPTGWTPIGELRPQDRVIAGDGTPTTVLGVYPQGVRPLFRVHTSDGGSVLCDAEHLWLTSDRSARRYNRPMQVRTTQQIADSLTFPNGPREGLNHCLPLQPIAQFPRRRLPVDPYVLGFWLGDGTRARVCGPTEKLDELEKVTPLGLRHADTRSLDNWQANVLGIGPALRALGLYELGSHERFIPEDYLFSSVEQRTALLQGLLDTDGYTNGAGNNTVSFDVTSPRLAEGVRHLVQSLGGVVRVAEKTGSYVRADGERRMCRQVYRTNLSLPQEIEPFRLPSKRAKYAPDWNHHNVRRTRERFISAAVPEGEGEAVCIAVEHPSKLFITQDFLVTHNTALLAWVILWFALSRYPYKIPCTAPSASQLTSALWPEIGKWYRKLHPALRRMLRLTSDRLELVSGEGTSFAEARTSRQDQPEALQGFHEDNLLFVVDEASGVPDIVFEVGAGSLSTPGAKIILTGNPTRTSGYFFDVFHPKPGQRKWWTMRVSCHESTRVDRRWIEEMEAQYGADSVQYAVRVLGDFPATDEVSYFPRHLVEAAVDRRKIIELIPGTVVWGVDVGWQGDRSAVAKRSGSHLLEPITWWSGKDPMQSVGKVMQMYEQTPRHLQPKEILIDVIGMGSGVFTRLREQGLPAVAVNVSNTAMDTSQYAKVREELYGKALDWFRLPDVTIPDDEEFIKELNHLQGKLQSNGRVYAESKKDMKSRGLRSPDILESFILTFAASSRWERNLSPFVAQMGMMMPAAANREYDPRRW